MWLTRQIIVMTARMSQKRNNRTFKNNNLYKQPPIFQTIWQSYNLDQNENQQEADTSPQEERNSMKWEMFQHSLQLERKTLKLFEQKGLAKKFASWQQQSLMLLIHQQNAQ